MARLAAAVAMLAALCLSNPARSQTNFPQVMPADTVYGAQFQSGPGVAIPFSVLAQRLSTGIGGAGIFSTLTINEPNTTTPNSAFIINKGSASSSALDIKSTLDNSGSLLRLYGPLDVNGPAQYFTTGGFLTKLFIAISGTSTGTGQSYGISLPTNDATMLSIWADVPKAAQFRCNAGATLPDGTSAILSAVNGSGSYVGAINCDGSLSFGSPTNATFAGMDTALGRGGPQTLQVGGSDTGAPIAQTFGAYNVSAPIQLNGQFLYGATFLFPSVAGINPGMSVVDQTNPACTAGTTVASVNVGATTVTVNQLCNPYNGDVFLFGGTISATMTNQVGSTRLGYASLPSSIVPAQVVTDVSVPTAISGGTTIASIDTSNPPGAGGNVLVVLSAAANANFNTAAGGHDTIQYGTQNTAAAALNIVGGKGTGTACGGPINLQGAPAGSSGTSQNSLQNYLTISPCSTPAVSFPGGTPGTLYADTFSGATSGDKIAACITALPAQGGTCDARGLPANGTIPGFTISDTGVTLLLPCGSQTVTGQILVSGGATQMSGMKIFGCNPNLSNASGTKLAWGAVDTTSPMIQVTGVRDSQFANFTIVGAAANPLNVGIQQSSGASTISTNNSYRDIIIEGVTTAGLNMGMRWTGRNANNDASKIERVQVNNYAIACISFEGTQSKIHMLDHVNCVGAFPTSQYGITTALSSVISATVAAAGTTYTNGTQTLTVTGGTCTQQPQLSVTVAGNVVTAILAVLVPGICTTAPSSPASTTGGGGTGATVTLTNGTSGSFTAYHQLMANNQIDFYLGSSDDAVAVYGGYSENSASLLRTSAISSASWPVMISGFNFEPNNLNADGKIVLFGLRGGLMLLNNRFGSPNTGVYPTLSLESNAFAEEATAIGNTIIWDTTSALSDPFVVNGGGAGIQAWRKLGNTLTSHVGATNQAVPDSMGTPTLYANSNAGFAAIVAAGGTGGTPGAVTLTTVGGTCGTHPTFTGTISAGGVLTGALVLATAGTCTVDPANPVAVTGGALSGTTLNLFYTNEILPSCDANHNHMILEVSDATGPTWKGAYSGGGAVQTSVVCVSGTGWQTGN